MLILMYTFLLLPFFFFFLVCVCGGGGGGEDWLVKCHVNRDTTCTVLAQFQSYYQVSPYSLKYTI